MATAERRRKSVSAAVTAWLSLLLGLYCAFAVATFWGALGGLGGGFGAWLSIRVLRQRPSPTIPTRIVAVAALILTALAFAAAVLIVVVVVLGKEATS